jgi:tetraacyldisaccharide-1-P 4'-kinase
MQNPYFKKDLVIMTIDGTRGFGNMMPIPAWPHAILPLPSALA